MRQAEKPPVTTVEQPTQLDRLFQGAGFVQHGHSQREFPFHTLHGRTTPQECWVSNAAVSLESTSVVRKPDRNMEIIYTR